jgi:hypothetical protein
MVAPGGLQMRREDGHSHAGMLGGINVGRERKRTLMLIHPLGNSIFSKRPDIRAQDIDGEAILELMVHYGSLEFAFHFGQGVATAAYESFHDAFANVPPSASRGFVEALIPYMLARVS